MAGFKAENQTITLTIPTQASIPVISISNWIFVLHRYVPSGFDWNLLWNDHKNGFGSSGSDDFFMGLERLHLLTTSDLRQLPTTPGMAARHDRQLVLGRILALLHRQRGRMVHNACQRLHSRRWRPSSLRTKLLFMLLYMLIKGV